ncbi:hypothetical protein ACWD7M_38335 [Streptomyces griseus]
MAPLPSRNARDSFSKLLAGGAGRTSVAVPIVQACPVVALYAVAPLRGAEGLVLDDLSAYVQDRGWIVPAGLAVADTGPLDQDPDKRAG